MFEARLQLGQSAILRLSRGNEERFIGIGLTNDGHDVIAILNKEEVQRLVNILLVMLEEL